MSEGRRGAARSEASRQAILRATAGELAAKGWDHLTIEGIATAAGVGKQTIYRWWSSKAAVLAEAMIEGVLLPVAFIPKDSGDLRADLTRWAVSILRYADRPTTGALFRSLLAASVQDPEVSAQLRHALEGESLLAARLASARDAGQLADDVPLKQVADALVGAIILHVIVRERSGEDTARLMVEAVLGPAGVGRA